MSTKKEKIAHVHQEIGRLQQPYGERPCVEDVLRVLADYIEAVHGICAECSDFGGRKGDNQRYYKQPEPCRTCGKEWND